MRRLVPVICLMLLAIISCCDGQTKKVIASPIKRNEYQMGTWSKPVRIEEGQQIKIFSDSLDSIHE